MGKKKVRNEGLVSDSRGVLWRRREDPLLSHEVVSGQRNEPLPPRVSVVAVSRVNSSTTGPSLGQGSSNNIPFLIMPQPPPPAPMALLDRCLALPQQPPQPPPEEDNIGLEDGELLHVEGSEESLDSLSESSEEDVTEKREDAISVNLQTKSKISCFALKFGEEVVLLRTEEEGKIFLEVDKYGLWIKGCLPSYYDAIKGVQDRSFELTLPLYTVSRIRVNNTQKNKTLLCFKLTPNGGLKLKNRTDLAMAMDFNDVEFTLISKGPISNSLIAKWKSLLSNRLQIVDINLSQGFTKGLTGFRASSVHLGKYYYSGGGSIGLFRGTIAIHMVNTQRNIPFRILLPRGSPIKYYLTTHEKEGRTHPLLIVSLRQARYVKDFGDKLGIENFHEFFNPRSSAKEKNYLVLFLESPSDVEMHLADIRKALGNACFTPTEDMVNQMLYNTRLNLKRAVLAEEGNSDEAPEPPTNAIKPGMGEGVLQKSNSKCNSMKVEDNESYEVSPDSLQSNNLQTTAFGNQSGSSTTVCSKFKPTFAEVAFSNKVNSTVVSPSEVRVKVLTKLGNATKFLGSGYEEEENVDYASEVLSDPEKSPPFESTRVDQEQLKEAYSDYVKSLNGSLYELTGGVNMNQMFTNGFIPYQTSTEEDSREADSSIISSKGTSSEGELAERLFINDQSQFPNPIRLNFPFADLPEYKPELFQSPVVEGESSEPSEPCKVKSEQGKEKIKFKCFGVRIGDYFHCGLDKYAEGYIKATFSEEGLTLKMNTPHFVNKIYGRRRGTSKLKIPLASIHSVLVHPANSSSTTFFFQLSHSEGERLCKKYNMNSYLFRFNPDEDLDYGVVNVKYFKLQTNVHPKIEHDIQGIRRILARIGASVHLVDQGEADFLKGIKSYRLDPNLKFDCNSILFGSYNYTGDSFFRLAPNPSSLFHLIMMHPSANLTTLDFGLDVTFEIGHWTNSEGIQGLLLSIYSWKRHLLTLVERKLNLQLGEYFDPNSSREEKKKIVLNVVVEGDVLKMVSRIKGVLRQKCVDISENPEKMSKMILRVMRISGKV